MANAPARQSLTTSAAALLLAVGAGALLLALGVESTKLFAASLGAALVLAGAFLSGNPRLYSLWGLMFTIPFDLSKRIGPIIAKMGGETSFRFEVSDVFLLALLAFQARDLMQGRMSGLRLPRVLLPWALLIAMGVFTVVFGTWRMTAAQEVVRMLKLTVLFVVVCNELVTSDRIFHCAAGLTLGLLAQSIVGLIQYVTRAHLGLDLLGETGAGTLEQLGADSVRSEKAFRAGAFLSHPNLFGIYLATLLPLTVAAFLLRRGRGYRAFFLLAAALGMAALIDTLSRSGWLSFAVAFVVLMGLLLLHQGLRRRALVPAGVAMVAFAAVALIFAEAIITRITESKESALLSRLEYIQDARGMIEARPILGWGMNSYVYAAPPFTRYGARGAHEKYKNWLPPVHNIYLLWWAELGIVGLLLELAVLAMVFRAATRNLRVSDEALYAINAACLCGLLAYLVDGMFSFSLRFNSILRVFWVQAAIIMAIHYWRLREGARLAR